MEACPSCGRLNRPGARFCASCRSPLGETQAPLQPGQSLSGGAFRVVRPLGKGGMGAVWLVAQTRAFDRLAVLKEVTDYFDPADAGARQKALERFEVEARTLADLKHPGIPDLYAYFSEGGHNYLVMEYIEGPDLSRGLTREDRDSGKTVAGAPVPAEQALAYTMQICEVLEHLASRQPPVVHNDIKPANIILDSHSGRAVLVDFGTAKTRYLKAAGAPDRKKDSVYGTVGYAAPELYRGQSEPRSDVYSLAATAYHLLTDDDPRDHPGQYPGLDALPPILAESLRGALGPEAASRPHASEFRQQIERYLAGLTAPLHALTFPDGDSARGLQELLEQAAKHWSYAAELLQDGSLARWLRGTLRDAASAQAADEAVARWPGDTDAALDAFLRRAGPTGLPRGQMELRTGTVRVAPSAGTSVRQTITIANRGQGYLRGEAYSSVPWVRVQSTFGCPPGGTRDLGVELDLSGLARDQSYVEAVTLEPEGGDLVVVNILVTGGRGEATREPARPPARPSAPVVDVRPAQVELVAGQGDLSSSRGRVTVSNMGTAAARCRLVGIPGWLVVKPEVFEVAPGAKQAVELVARVAKVPARRVEAPLAVAVEGGQGREVRVTVQIRGRGLFG